MPRAHAIDYEIRDHEMQYVEIELDPSESAVSTAEMGDAILVALRQGG
jgi:uncharacterized protein (AIM24 family)